MQLPEADDVRLALGAALGAFEASGGLDALQTSVFEAVARAMYDLDLVADPIEPLAVETFTAAVADPALRRKAVAIMAVLEMVAHPLTPEAAAGVRAYAHRAGVDAGVLHAMSQQANHHVALMHADFERSSWYTRQTVKGALHGQFRELMASKLAYSGLVIDKRIGRRWLALQDCAEGSWGREVADFYTAHSFPFPGTHKGIYELGAKHDWVHVLAGYEATPEGEIDVFGFIAASMPGDDGSVLLAVTLGLFQNGSIQHVGGKRIKIARRDTLGDPGAVDRFADALRRGALTNVDVMGIDQFAYADVPLDEVREKFNVVPARL